MRPLLRCAGHTLLMGGTTSHMAAASHHMLTAASANLCYYGVPCSAFYLLRIIVDLSSGARPDSP